MKKRSFLCSSIPTHNTGLSLSQNPTNHSKYSVWINKTSGCSRRKWQEIQSVLPKGSMVGVPSAAKASGGYRFPLFSTIPQYQTRTSSWMLKLERCIQHIVVGYLGSHRTNIRSKRVRVCRRLPPNEVDPSEIQTTPHPADSADQENLVSQLLLIEEAINEAHQGLSKGKKNI